MFRHILIATDGSEVAKRAVDQGIALAKALQATVTAVTVTEPISPTVGVMGMASSAKLFETQIADLASKVLSPIALAAKAAGVACNTIHIAGQHPAEGIIEAAKQHGCDVIVMAPHGRRGLKRLLLGSQTQEVVTLSPIPVLVWR